MSATPKKHSKVLNSGNSTGSDYDWIIAGSDNTQQRIYSAVIVNNDDATQTITVKVQNYSGAYSSILTKSYSIAAGETDFISELYDQVLIGNATYPDKVTVAFNTTLTSTDVINCLAGAVEFA